MKGVRSGKNLEGIDVILTEMPKQSSDISTQETTNSQFHITNFPESLTTAFGDLRLTDIGSTPSSGTQLQESSWGANYGVTNYNYSTSHSSFSPYNMSNLPSYLFNVPVNSSNTRRLPEVAPASTSSLLDQLYVNDVGLQNLHRHRLSGPELYRMSPQLNGNYQSISSNMYTDGYNSEPLIGRHEPCRFVNGERLQYSCVDNPYRARTTRTSHELYPQEIIDMAKDQNGCLHLQNVLNEGNSYFREYVCMHVIANIVELTIDSSGNDLVKLLVERSNVTQITKIVCEITKVPSQLLMISCDTYGTRVVQKVIEAIKRRPELTSMVISSLNPGVLDLMMDPNGNHVIQRCLQHMDPEYTLFILETALAHCFDLARNQQGCCVLQKCIFHSSEIIKKQLVQSITTNAPILAQDQFANYVIQFIIKMKVPGMTNRMVNRLNGWFGALSMQKCSSNVVQKCLEHGGEANCERIIRELMLEPDVLLNICRDQFGNYVIQSATKFSKGAIRDKLLKFIGQHSSELQNSTFGKILLTKLRKNSSCKTAEQ